MSHLKPVQPGTTTGKTYAEYTPDEVVTALPQLQDEANRLVAAKKPIDQRLAQTIVEFAKRSDRSDTVSDDVKRAAAGK